LFGSEVLIFRAQTTRQGLQVFLPEIALLFGSFCIPGIEAERWPIVKCTFEWSQYGRCKCFWTY